MQKRASRIFSPHDESIFWSQQHCQGLKPKINIQYSLYSERLNNFRVYYCYTICPKSLDIVHQIALSSKVKSKILWESRKNLKQFNLSFFWHYLYSSIKEKWKIVSNFCSLFRMSELYVLLSISDALWTNCWLQ